MSKKNKNKGGLGRALINDRFGKNNARRSKDPSILHSSEVPDGYDWGRLNLKSVTEESSFQEFLSTAQLAGTEFQTEKLNITFINPFVGSCLMTKQERERVNEAQEENKQFLAIPRRPKWDETTTREQLEETENVEFLEWRRRLALLQEEKQFVLTPYEKNLEFWRQLWRVVERSDVVIQIVDARNPLLFFCEDLQNYVCEVSPYKENLILLNKADFLTDTQRQEWSDYFEKLGVRVAFYSATSELTETESDDKTEEDELLQDRLRDLQVGSDENEVQSSKNEEDRERSKKEDTLSNHKDKSTEDNPDKLMATVKLKNEEQDSEVKGFSSCDSLESEATDNNKQNRSVKNSSKLLNRFELIGLFRSVHLGKKVTANVTTMGLVGYPNVGKSSTINSLLLEKKVSVSATPGKTKHFQTLYLDKDLLLCDCPGLVMPSFVYSKADMVINGILPIDQMRDHVPPVSLVASLIPRHVLEDTYGIMIPKPREGEDPMRPPTSEELLNAYGYNRGFMTQNGQPDNPRSARLILKDFVNGKLLYCHAPPGWSQENFHKFPVRTKKLVQQTPKEKRIAMASTSSELDKTFFKDPGASVHNKGYSSASIAAGVAGVSDKKPWKDHSNKRNKREKLRRIYAHLDQH